MPNGQASSRFFLPPAPGRPPAADETGSTTATNIEDIEVGDWVWSRNEHTGEEGLKPVTRLFRNEADTLVHLTYTSGAGASAARAGTHTITGTEEHPFWSVTRNAWVPMGQLQAGETLLLGGPALSPSKGGQTATATSVRIEQLATPVAVYNFEVADWHTYHVGTADTGWVYVHNTCAEELRKMNLLGWAKGKEAGHFRNHGVEMGFKSGREYTSAARQFAKSEAGEVVKVGKNAYFKYNEASNSVLIVINRKIKTFYTANKGRRSFLEAIAKHRQVLRNKGAPHGVQRGTGNGAVTR